MLRLPLEKTVLNVKLLFSGFGVPTELLAKSLSPPPPERIKAAVNSLYTCGALVSADESSAITFLGKFAAHLPVDLPLVKLVLFGMAFDCCPDTVVMAAALSLQDIFLMPSSLFIRDVPKFAAELAANLQARTAFDQGKYSEPLSYLTAYKSWLTSHRTVRAARSLGLSHSRVTHLDQLVADLANRAKTALADHGQAQHSALDRLQSCARRRGGCRAEELHGVFTQDTDLLRMILAGVCTSNILIGSVKPSKSVGEFAQNRKLQICKLATELNSQSKLQAALDPLCLKVTGLKPSKSGKVEVELEETLSIKDDMPTIASLRLDLQNGPVIHDTCIAVKFLSQLVMSYRQKLLLPNPNHCPGSDAAPLVMLGTVALESRVSWKLEGGPPALLYSRSPFGVQCSFNQTYLNGVALSILGGQGDKVWAEGVTLFETAPRTNVRVLLWRSS